MPQLIHKRTGRPVEVSMQQLEEALRSREYQAPENATIDIYDPDINKVRQVPLKDYLHYRSLGYVPPTEEQRKRAALEEKYDQPLVAGIAGAARGLTFGLSDLALTKLGLVDPETLKNLLEFNPTASAVGEYGAIVATTLLSGGAAGAAKGAGSLLARGAATMPRLVSQAGEAAAKMILGGAAKSSIGAARRIAASVAQGAVEGAAYGVGHAVSETALGNLDGSIDSILAEAGMGALLGGGLTGALTSAGVIASKAGRFTIDQAKKLIEHVAPNISTQAQELAARKLYTQVAGSLTGGKRQLGYLLERPGALEDVAVTASEVGDLATQLAKAADKVEEMSDIARMFGAKAGKANALAEKISLETDTAVVRDAAQDTLAKTREMLDAIAAEPHRPGVVQGLQKILKETETRIESSIKSKTANKDIFLALDDFKRSVGAYADNMNRLVNMASDPATQQAAENTRRYLISLYENNLRPLLENEAIFGKAAATAQREINAAWHDLLESTVGVQVRPFFKRAGVTEWEEQLAGAKYFKREADPKAFEGYIQSLGDTARSPLEERYWFDRLQKTETLLDRISKHTGSEEALKAASEFRGVRREFESVHQRAREIMEAKSALRQLDEGAKAIMPAVGTSTLVGWVAGGAPGAVIGGVLSALVNPASTIRVLAGIKRLAGNVGGEAFSAIRQLIGRGTNRVIRATVPVFTLEQLKQDKERFGRLAADPASLAAQVPGHEDYPILSQLAAQRATAAVQILTEAMPKQGGGRKNIPDAELRKYALVRQAVLEPKKVLQRIKAGIVTKEEIDTIRHVYPGLYATLRDNLVDALAEAGDKVPYAKRVRLSYVFGFAATPEMQPENLAIIQKAVATLFPAPAQGTATGMPKLTPAQRQKSLRASMSRTQRLEEVVA